VLDLLGEGDEPLTFYCLHDADGPGTMIYQTLQNGTTARPGRRVEIVNLGLDADEATAMGLPAETIEAKGRTVPVADYVSAEWRGWLQTRRVELNALDTPAMLEWLDAKMKAAAGGKVIPPAPVMAARLTAEARGLIRAAITAEAIRGARVEDRTDQALAAIQPRIDRTARRLPALVGRELAAEPTAPWTTPVVRQAAKLTGQPAPAPSDARKTDKNGKVVSKLTSAQKRAVLQSMKHTPKDQPATMAEIGISEKAAKTYATLAAIPQDAIEEYMAYERARDGEVTHAGLLRWWRRRRKASGGC
jgi:hypothetical protein